MHCIGCGDDISKIPSKRRSLCSDSVGDPGPGDSWRLCQKFLIVPKLCKTRLAHSPWILLINCSVTDGDPLASIA